MMNQIEKENRHSEIVRLAEQVALKTLDNLELDYKIAVDSLAFVIANSATSQTDCRLFVEKLLKTTSA